MRTIKKIITRVDSRFGAPMGRDGKGTINDMPLPFGVKVYDCAVPLNSGGYDAGGAYWGFPDNLRVQYTKDLSFVRFYRRS